jgi:hypothetical protein
MTGLAVVHATMGCNVTGVRGVHGVCGVCDVCGGVCDASGAHLSVFVRPATGTFDRKAAVGSIASTADPPLMASGSYWPGAGMSDAPPLPPRVVREQKTES